MNGIKMLLLGAVSLSAPILFVRQAVTLTHQKDINKKNELTISTDSLEINQLKRELDSARVKNTVQPSPTVIAIKPSPITINYPSSQQQSLGPSDGDSSRISYAKIVNSQKDLDILIMKIKNPKGVPLANKTRLDNNKQYLMDEYFRLYDQAYPLTQKYQNSPNSLLRTTAVGLSRTIDTAANAVKALQ